MGYPIRFQVGLTSKHSVRKEPKLAEAKAALKQDEVWHPSGTQRRSKFLMGLQRDTLIECFELYIPDLERN